MRTCAPWSGYCSLQRSHHRSVHITVVYDLPDILHRLWHKSDRDCNPHPLSPNPFSPFFESVVYLTICPQTTRIGMKRANELNYWITPSPLCRFLLICFLPVSVSTPWMFVRTDYSSIFWSPKFRWRGGDRLPTFLERGAKRITLRHHCLISLVHPEKKTIIKIFTFCWRMQ